MRLMGIRIEVRQRNRQVLLNSVCGVTYVIGDSIFSKLGSEGVQELEPVLKVLLIEVYL